MTLLSSKDPCATLVTLVLTPVLTPVQTPVQTPVLTPVLIPVFLAVVPSPETLLTAVMETWPLMA